MSLFQTLNKDMISSLKAGEKLRLSTLRMLISAVKMKQIDAKRDLTDEEIISLIQTLIKQRNEAAKVYKEGGREELAQKEKDEIEFLKVYMPEQLSEEEVRAQIQKIKIDTGASSMGDMGSLMKASMAVLKGKADGSLVNKIVKEVLS